MTFESMQLDDIHFGYLIIISVLDDENKFYFKLLLLRLDVFKMSLIMHCDFYTGSIKSTFSNYHFEYMYSVLDGFQTGVPCLRF